MENNDVWLSEEAPIKKGVSRDGMKYLSCQNAAELRQPIIQGRHPLDEIDVRELAHLSVIFDDHSSFFKMKHGITTYYSADTNGSGNQNRHFEISGQSDDMIIRFEANFMPTSSDTYVYIADAWKDRRKDYEPTRRIPDRKFDVTTINLKFRDYDSLTSWVRDVYPVLDRHATALRKCDVLSNWVDAGLDMRVSCDYLFCGHSQMILNEDLLSYLRKGEDLSSLRKKLVCGKCGRGRNEAFGRHYLRPWISSDTENTFKKSGAS